MKDTAALARLQALAHHTRLDTVRLLAQHPDGLPASVVASSLGLERNVLSGHLRILALSGLIAGSRAGRNITYRLRRRALEDLVDLLNTL